jgi:hypothetical protein
MELSLDQYVPPDVRTEIDALPDVYVARLLEVWVPSG